MAMVSLYARAANVDLLRKILEATELVNPHHDQQYHRRHHHHHFDCWAFLVGVFIVFTYFFHFFFFPWIGLVLQAFQGGANSIKKGHGHESPRDVRHSMDRTRSISDLEILRDHSIDFMPGANPL